jgi:hypothetical protein
MSRPSYKPTEEHRRTVKTMATVGVRQEDIALALDITPKTLRKHFGQELTRGSIEAAVKVGQTLLTMAVSGRNLGASIYWDRTRGLIRRSSSETGSHTMLPPQIIIRASGQEKQSTEGGPER